MLVVKKQKLIHQIQKHFVMEQVKKFLGAALVVTAGFAMYELIVKPMVDKAKTSMPSTK